MVKRGLTYLLGSMAALALLGALGLAWLLGTNSGARTVLGWIDRLTPLELAVEEVEGRLAGPLTLAGVRWQGAGGEGQCQRLHFDWHPSRLLRGELDVAELQVSDIEVRLPAPFELAEPAPKQPLNLIWPTLEGWPMRVKARLGLLRLERLRLQQGEGEPKDYPELQLVARWGQGVLELTQLLARTPFGDFQGELLAGFDRPALKADLRARWPELGPLLDGLRLELALDPEATRENLTGQLQLATLLGEAEQARLQTRFRLRRQGVDLDPLALDRAAAPDQVRGTAALDLARQPPTLTLGLEVERLNLGPETGFDSDLTGTIAVSGGADGYQGRVDLRNQGEGWKDFALAAAVAGDFKGLRLDQVRGRFMRGDIGGQAKMHWTAGFDLQAELRGRHLDPAQITPDWPGTLNFDLGGTLGVGRKRPLTIDVNGKFLESTLRGRALEGVVDGAWRGAELELRRLALQGEGIELSAQGLLSRRIDYKLNIPRLGGVIPEAAGKLSGEGWVQWQPGQAAGEIRLQGAELAYQEHALARLDLLASQPALDAPFELNLLFQEGQSGVYRVDRGRLRLEGTPEAHRLALELAWPRGTGKLQAQGAYVEEVWKGQLNALEVKDPRAGNWQLQEPVDLTAGRAALKFSPLVLASGQREELRLNGDLHLQPLQGELVGEWSNIDLSHLQPWLGELKLSGRSTGTLAARWRPEERREFQITLDLAGRIIHGDLDIGLRQVEGELDWTEQGLLALWDINLEQGGELTGRLASAQPMATGLPKSADFYLDWTKLNLGLLQPLLPQWQLSGASQGGLSGQWWDDGRIELRGEIGAQAKLQQDEVQFDLSQAGLTFDWGAKGLQSRLELHLADGGRLTGAAATGTPARQALPEQGDFRFDWERLDLALLRPWLPEGLRLEGALKGGASGRWLPEGALTLQGQNTIGQGRLEWRDEDGTVSAPLRKADLDWRWQQQSLTGNLELVLAEYGNLAAGFALPLPAKIPTAIDPGGPVRLDLTANLREKGLISALLPGLVQESRGQVAADLHAAGSWENPRFSGNLQLKQAGAFLPSAGIQLRDLELAAHLEEDEVILDRFGVRAGKGHLRGEGRIKLRNWRPAEYSGTLKGENFLAVNQPELQLHLSPDLKINGDPDKLKIRGDLLIPEMLVQGRQTPSPVRPSDDVIVVDAATPAVRELLLALDAIIGVRFGDRVLIKVSGVDARLGGKATLTMTGLTDVTAQGEINVVQGSYAAYGVKLNITRGSLLFAGGPVDRPTLDLLALRTVGETKAGIQVSGTPRRPQVKLYSDPAMPDTDILAYVVLGRPFDQQGGNTDLLMLAAGGLLSKGDSAVLQDKLKNALGLDVIDIQSGGGDVAGSMITIGKYLTPELYISFGQSLFTNLSQARLRYQISRRWELESVFGVESGADLYYKIEFE